MEKFVDWQTFWKEWRNIPAESEYDLYFQVAKTVNSKPMDRELFDIINSYIVGALNLQPADVLIELCCGNGLCTYELAKSVKEVVAIDFSPHLIADAKKFKSASNIKYLQSDVIGFLQTYKPDKHDGTVKCLMNDSLAYFVPQQLQDILASINLFSGRNFEMLIRGVPNDELKWNYYDTEARKNRYHQLVEENDITNDGIGRWWKPSEIMDVCNELGLLCSISDQEQSITNYRMDVFVHAHNSNIKDAIY